MNEKYISEAVQSGILFDKLIEKLIKYNPESFTYNVIGTDSENPIDVVNYFRNFSQTQIYNFSVFNYINAPSGVTTSPIDIRIVKLADNADGEVRSYLGLFLSDRCGNIYYRECDAEDSDWIDLSTTNIVDKPDPDTLVYIYRDKAEPALGAHKNAVWINPDTGFIKCYQNGQILGNLVVDDMMEQATYNPNNIDKSPHTYLSDLLDTILHGYGDYLKHKVDELTFVHVTAEDKNRLNTTLYYTSQVDENYNTWKTDFLNLIANRFEDITSVNKCTSDINEGKALQDAHYNAESNHLTEEQALNFNSKSPVDHTHDGSTVTITPDDISGRIKLDNLPDDIKERIYPITSLDVLKSSSITEEEKTTGKYHIGNILVIQNNGTDITRWYKIVDSSYIGTSRYMEAVLEFTVIDSENIYFSNIQNTPTTLAGYNIADGITKSEADVLLDAINDKVQVLDGIDPNVLLSDYTGSVLLKPNSTVAAIGFRYKRNESINMIIENSSADIYIKLKDLTTGEYSYQVSSITKYYTPYSVYAELSEEEFNNLWNGIPEDKRAIGGSFVNTDNTRWNEGYGAVYDFEIGTIPSSFEFSGNCVGLVHGETYSGTITIINTDNVLSLDMTTSLFFSYLPSAYIVNKIGLFANTMNEIETSAQKILDRIYGRSA